MSDSKKCAKCNGTGKQPCPMCHGSGYNVGPKRFFVGLTLHRSFGKKPCALCNGRRTVGMCSGCFGSGIAEESTSGV
jgi:DnaJ-class molecular chaperone